MREVRSPRQLGQPAQPASPAAERATNYLPVGSGGDWPAQPVRGSVRASRAGGTAAQEGEQDQSVEQAEIDAAAAWLKHVEAGRIW